MVLNSSNLSETTLVGRDFLGSRIFSFLDPSSGNNYQSEKASEAIIGGGFFGKGVGEGTLNNRIPEAHTDYIVSVISEEF